MVRRGPSMVWVSVACVAVRRPVSALAGAVVGRDGGDVGADVTYFISTSTKMM